MRPVRISVLHSAFVEQAHWACTAKAVIGGHKRNSHKKAQKSKNKSRNLFVPFVPFCGYSSYVPQLPLSPYKPNEPAQRTPNVKQKSEQGAYQCLPRQRSRSRVDVESKEIKAGNLHSAP